MKIVIAVGTLLLLFAAAALGQTERQPSKIFTCSYHGELSFGCRHILNRTAQILKQNSDASVVMVGGDDSTGEYLTGKGIEAERISEKESSGHVLVLVIRFKRNQETR